MENDKISNIRYYILHKLFATKSIYLTHYILHILSLSVAYLLVAGSPSFYSAALSFFLLAIKTRLSKTTQ